MAWSTISPVSLLSYYIHLTMGLGGIFWTTFSAFLTKTSKYVNCRIIVFSIWPMPLKLGCEPKWCHLDVLRQAIENQRFKKLKKFCSKAIHKICLLLWRNKILGVRCTLKCLVFPWLFLIMPSYIFVYFQSCLYYAAQLILLYLNMWKNVINNNDVVGNVINWF